MLKGVLDQLGNFGLLYLLPVNFSISSKSSCYLSSVYICLFDFSDDGEQDSRSECFNCFNSRTNLFSISDKS